MKTYRLSTLFFNLLGLGLSVWYFFVHTEYQSLSFWLMVLYLVNIASTYTLSKHLHRSPYLWGALSIPLPFLTPIVLSLLPYVPRERMDYADIAWARMDTPNNPMIVTGVMIFNNALDVPRAKEGLAQRLLAFDRFRQRMVHRAGLHNWEEMEVDLDHHIQVVSLPEGSGKPELENLVGELMSQHLDWSKPLWRAYVVENYGEGNAVVFRAHHCLADGIALVRVLMSLTEDHADNEPPPNHPKPFIPQPPPFPNFLIVAASYLASMAKLLFTGPDNKSLLRGNMNGQKRATWSRDIPLAPLKAAGSKLGVTLNDMVATAMAGAIASYLKEKGYTRKNFFVRFMVPVNLRPWKEEVELGNRFALVIFKVPLGVEDPNARLKAVHKAMMKIKRSMEPFAAYHIIRLIGLGPMLLHKLVLSIFAIKVSAVSTNVPGTPYPVYFSGTRLDSVIAWVPQAGKIGTGISVFSYDGEVTLGLTTDSALIDDPANIMERVYGELDKLMALAESKTEKVS